MNSGPVAQLSPIEKRSRCSSATESASTPWPASIVPIGSIVPLIMSGSSTPASRRAARTPSAAALTFSVSWAVSSSSASTPPAMSAAAWRP